MFCKLFYKFVSDAECDWCDKRSGFEKDTWQEVCRRFERHPLIGGVKWWLKPKALKFKLFIIVRWFTRRLPLEKPWMIWSNRSGLHVGRWKPNWSWVEPQSQLEENSE